MAKRHTIQTDLLCWEKTPDSNLPIGFRNPKLKLSQSPRLNLWTFPNPVTAEEVGNESGSRQQVGWDRIGGIRSYKEQSPGKTFGERAQADPLWQPARKRLVRGS